MPHRTHTERRTGGTGARARASRPGVPRQDAGVRLQRQMGNRLFQRMMTGTRAPLVQRCACGGSCADCRGEGDEARRVQTALAVGAPDDAFEREAEQVAGEVMRMPAPAGPALAGGEAAPAIRRLPAGGGGVAPPPASLPAAGARGLAPETLAFMQPRFGADFSSVRLHTGPQAEAAAGRLGARAFTYGSDIWLGRGAAEGERRLMAHELTHVVQQGGGAPRRVSRQTITPSCTPAQAAVLGPAWAEGERLTRETIGTLERMGDVNREEGGALRWMPTAANVLLNAFGDVTGLQGLSPGDVGMTNLPRVVEKFRRIQGGFSAGKNLRCDPQTVGAGNECAWRAAFVVDGNSSDIFLCPTFFDGTGADRDTERGATLLHEMAHLELRARHAGLPERQFPGMMFDCGTPLGLSFDDALRNAFAYDLLANCLHGTRPTTVVEMPAGSTPGTGGAANPRDRRFAITGSAGGRLLDDGRHFAALLGARFSLREGEMVVFNPVIGLNLLYVPGADAAPAHLGAAVLDVGLRIQQPLRGVYVDLLGSGYAGFEAQPGAPVRGVGGVGGALGVGWRWDRLELGAEARGLVPLENVPTVDRGTLLILGRGAVRF